MSSRVHDTMARARDELRHEPTEKRIRAMLGDRPVVDSARALLVWEPRRVVPSYAVPAEDVHGELLPASGAREDVAPSPGRDPGDAGSPAPPVLHPGIPFSAHSAEGEPLSVGLAGDVRDGAAFRPADPDLAGYVILDFRGFDAWYEEDERMVAHPRDPFHRIDILESSREVRVELDGRLLAESSRPVLLFETNLPVRFYLPPEDLHLDRRPSAKRTYCAYKGEASYWSLEIDGRTRDDLAWSYERPLREAAAITGLVAFLDERVDVDLDGERRPRPRTVFSSAIPDEAGL